MRAAEIINPMRLQEVTQHRPHLYLDMDGVQADFFTAWAKLSGKQRYKEIGDRAQREASIADLNARGAEFIEQFFATLPVLSGAQTLIKFLRDNDIKYTILSAPLRGNEEASIRGKLAWLDRYHPGTSGTAVFTDEKQRYATTNGNPNVLVDDFKKYVNAWSADGGIAVLYRWNNVAGAIDQLRKIYGIDQPGRVNSLEALREATLGTLYPPTILGTFQIDDIVIALSKHLYDRAEQRKIPLSKIESTIRRLRRVKSKMKQHGPGSRFWVHNPYEEIALGFQVLDSGAFKVNTVIAEPPHAQGEVPIIRMYENLTELWTQPYELTSRATGPANMEYYFDTKDNRSGRIVFDSFLDTDQGGTHVVLVIVHFYIDNLYHTSGKGDAVAIFSTVVAACRDYLRRYKPPVVTFETDDAKKRNLYVRMTGMFPDYVIYPYPQWVQDPIVGDEIVDSLMDGNANDAVVLRRRDYDPEKTRVYIDEQDLTETKNSKVLFIGNDTAIVGQEHGKRLQLSDSDAERVQAIAQRHGAWYEGNGMDRKLTAGIIDDYAGSWDDDLLSPNIKGYPAPFLYVLFSNIKENDTVEGKIGSDPDSTIFDRILDTQPSTNYFPDRKFDAETLQKFLKSVSEGQYDFVQMSQAPATKRNVRQFFELGEQLMWPNNWEEYPNRAGRVAKSVNDLRDKFLALRKRGVYVAGSDHLQAVQQFLDQNKQGVAEGKHPGQPVVDAILKVMPIAQEIWFHGSRATGKHRRNSDTDILVVVPDDLVGNQYLGAVRILQKLSTHFDNYDIQPTKAETNIHRIAQEEGKLLWSKQGVAEGLNFDEIYGKYLKVTDNNGDPDKPGFSLVTPLNGDSWNWRERPEFKDLVKQKLNNPGFLGDHKYQQIIDAMSGKQFDPTKHIAKENFADGKVKGKSRPGRVKRAGASCNGSVTDLRQRAKNASGEKAKMYHWCANMKSGRQRSNEAEMPYQDAVDAGAMSTASMAQNVIQDIKSKIEQLSQQANSIRDEIKRTKSAQAAIPTGAQQIKVTPTGNWTARDQQGRGMAGGAVGLPPQKSKKS